MRVGNEPGEFQRDLLYEAVWTLPASRLAKQLGISDVGIHKICKKLNVPSPPLGYWARVAAGQAVERTPLPALAPVSSYFRPGTAGYERLKALRPPGTHSKNRPTSLQQLEAATRKALHARLDLLEALIAKGADSADDAAWEQFATSGFDLSTLAEGALQVSESGAAKALEILDALHDCFRTRGCKFQGDAVSGYVPFQLGDSDLSATVREEFIPGSLTRTEGKRVTAVNTLVGSGEFTLKIRGAGLSQLEVRDHASGLLQAIRGGAVMKALHAKANVAALGRLAVSKGVPKPTATHAATTPPVAADGAASEQIRREAAAWEEAQRIRRYAVHISESMRNMDSPLLLEWVAQCEREADAVDPTASRKALLQPTKKPRPGQ